MTSQRGRLWSFLIDNSLLLVAGTVAGLAWANLHHPSYERWSHALHFAVNDVGMVFFFALAVKEIVEATLPGGPLESPVRTQQSPRAPRVSTKSHGRCFVRPPPRTTGRCMRTTESGC